jgi:hypothetical protein
VSPARAQDSTLGVDSAVVALTAPPRAGLSVRPLFSPTALYSPSRGFGLGGGVELRGLGAPDSELEIQARISQHQLGGETVFYTGDRYRRPLFGMLGASLLSTDRLAFYGVGPRSVQEGKLWLDQVSGEVEARIGWYPTLNSILMLQPQVRFQYDRLDAFEPARDSALQLSDQRDIALLESLVGEDRYGLEVGLQAISDTRDRLASPNRGFLVQGGVSRFIALDGSELLVNRAELSGYRFFPAPIALPFLPERGAVFIRGSLVVTRQSGGADEPLPPFYLPYLDAELLAGYPPRRFVGRDGFSVGVGTRGTILALFGAVLIEGFSIFMVGSAYDDVFAQFTPRVAFDAEPADVNERVPLRPSVAVGLNFVTIDRDRPIIGGLLGVGPEGFVLSSFRIVYDIRSFRPRVR